jgi:hypothetical protein
MARKQLSAEDAQSLFGIKAIHEQMDNGELRFRLMGSNGAGSGYIRTEARSAGGWQKSHKHLGTTETYIVEREWMALASMDQRQPSAVIKIYRPGQIVTTEIGVVHNVYLPTESIIHTVKITSEDGGTDWIPAPKFDEITHPISEADLLLLDR